MDTGPLIWSGYSSLGSQSQSFTIPSNDTEVETSWLIIRSVENSVSDVTCSREHEGRTACSYSVNVISKSSLHV